MTAPDERVAPQESQVLGPKEEGVGSGRAGTDR